MAGESFILMGVSGSGKTLIGSKVAALLSAKFIDGDDLHPAKNIDKMSQGIPLSDEDRLPWLERLNDASYSLYKKNETGFKRVLKSLRELPLCFCEFPNSANAPSSWHHQLLGKAEWIHQLLLNHLSLKPH